MMKKVTLSCLLLSSLVATTCIAQRVKLDGALGANFNGEYQDVQFDDLRNAHAQWVRGFIAMTDVNPDDAGAQTAISTSLAAEKQGFHTIFTLKWPFQKTGIPVLGSPRYVTTLHQLDAVLALVMGRVDILEIGNEPYWETPENEHDQRLNAFYEAIAMHVIAYRDKTCPGACPTHIFMGALNRLNVQNVRQMTWVVRWLAFAHNTPQIDGVDIHPHVDSLDASRPYVDYVVQRLRPNQKFLATEFSLVWYWRAHLHDRVPALFAQQYGLSNTQMVWQAIAAAIQRPYSQQQWDDLLTQSPWFAAQSHYIDAQMGLFRSTGKLAVATYGFEQGASMTHNFGPKSVPWLLNSVYARRTVQQNADGSTPTNPYWLAAFRRMNSK